MIVSVDLDMITKWAGVLAGFFTAVGWIIRLLIKYFTSNKLKEIEESSDISAYNRLLNEIQRMDLIIKERDKDIEILENKLEKLRSLELDGAADLGKLSAFIDQFPCSSNCQNPASLFASAQTVMKKINDRKKEKYNIFSDSNDNENS